MEFRDAIRRECFVRTCTILNNLKSVSAKKRSQNEATELSLELSDPSFQSHCLISVQLYISSLA